jgi:MFS family permease
MASSEKLEAAGELVEAANSRTVRTTYLRRFDERRRPIHFNRHTSFVIWNCECSQSVLRTAQGSRRSGQVRYLVAGFSCWMFGAQLTRASQVELLLSNFQGNTVAMASLTGRVSTLSAIIGIFVNPIVGSMADAFGRRGVLIAGAAFSIVRPMCWLLSPDAVTGFVIAETAAPIAQVCAILPPQAAVADMYKHDKVQLASRQSLLFLVPAVCQIVCPILGGALAAYQVMLPFAIAAVTASASGVVAYAMSEPLPKDQRKPFRWMASTPLSALTLFARGRYMRSLAIIQVLMDLSETAGRPDRGAAALVELHQKEMGWGVLDRNSWRSMCGVIRSPGNLAVASFTALLGTQNALSLGFVVRTLRILLWLVALISSTRTELGAHGCAVRAELHRPSACLWTYNVQASTFPLGGDVLL